MSTAKQPTQGYTHTSTEPLRAARYSAPEVDAVTPYSRESATLGVQAPAQTIRLCDVELALAAAKLRRWRHGATAQFCALTPSPTVQVDCRANSAWTRKGLVQAAIKMGFTRAHLGPMQRGHIAMLYEHVRRTGGLAEVRATWGVGIQTLRAEPRHVLNGGHA